MSWNSFFHTIAPQPQLVLYRILFGSVVFGYFLYRLPHASFMYDWDGLGRKADRVTGGLNLLSYLPETKASIYAVWTLGCVASLALAIGFLTPVAAAVLFVTTATLNSQLFIPSGFDSLVSLMSLLFVFSPAGNALSIDRLIYNGDFSDRFPADDVWLLRLMQCQVALVYFWTGAKKVLRGRDVWLGGTAAHEAYLAYGKRLRLSLLDRPTVYRAVTWYIVFIELLFPLLVLWPPSRYPCLAGVLLTHLGIELTFDTFPFQWLMIASLALFLSQEDASKILSLVFSAVPHLA